MHWEDFPGHPVVKTPHLQNRGMGLIPVREKKIPYALWCGQKIKKKKQKKERKYVENIVLQI